MFVLNGSPDIVGDHHHHAAGNLFLLDQTLLVCQRQHIQVRRESDSAGQQALQRFGVDVKARQAEIGTDAAGVPEHAVVADQAREAVVDVELDRCYFFRSLFCFL